MTAAGDFTGTGTVREAHRFDEARLDRWLADNVADYRGPLQVEQFKGGQSNPTYKLVTSTRAYVLRRKPPGPLLKGAHAVEREAQVLQALQRCDFPVAPVLALCTDDTVIGSWFYVMDFVAGRIFWDATFPEIGRQERPRYFDAMNETIARLHTVDYRQAGLGDYGKPGNYFARQISRWSRQYVEDEQVGRDEYMDRLVEWLPSHIPKGDETTLVHGDFRVDNLIFHPTEPRILAVLDWELSTLGHPLGDFCYHLMMYRMPPTLIAGLVGSDLDALNIPSETQYVADYCRQTCRSGIEHLDFYMAFNLFRLAAIFHGIKGRLIRGTAASAKAQDMAASLPILARLGWEQTRS